MTNNTIKLINSIIIILLIIIYLKKLKNKYTTSIFKKFIIIN